MVPAFEKLPLTLSLLLLWLDAIEPLLVKAPLTVNVPSPIVKIFPELTVQVVTVLPFALVTS